MTVPRMIVGGLVVLALFVLWQWRTTGEPLVPLRLFAERNFTLANLALIPFAYVGAWEWMGKGSEPTLVLNLATTDPFYNANRVPGYVNTNQVVLTWNTL